jgi:hypothetical protein
LGEIDCAVMTPVISLALIIHGACRLCSRPCFGDLHLRF